MIQSQNQNEAFRRQSDDCEASAINHEPRVRVTRGDRLRIYWFASGTRRTPATLFSLVILLCGFSNTATAEDDNKKTILLKDAGVIQKADEVPKKNVVRPARRIRRDLNNLNPNLDFLKPLINVELSFVKRVCEPTDDQMAAIVVAAKDAHEAMASILTDQGQAFNPLGRNQQIFMGPNQERMSVNPYIRVREDVANLLKPLLSAEQYTRFVAEAKSRDEYERDAAVGTVLEMLDAKLILSPEQQTQLQEKLSADETLPDLHTLSVYSSNTQYMPQLSERLITPVLTEAQKQIWSSLNRISFHQSILQGNSEGFTEDWLK